MLKSIIMILSLCWWPFIVYANVKSIDDIEFSTADGKPLPLSTFKGQAILIVNTGSICTSTQQYPLIQEVWERYNHRGLIVIGVSNNEFSSQWQADQGQVAAYCQDRRLSFYFTSPVSTKGKSQHPFFTWITNVFGAAALPNENFAKYLVDSKGKPVAWFLPTTPPNAPNVIKAIEAALPPYYQYRPNNMLPDGTQPNTLPSFIRP